MELQELKKSIKDNKILSNYGNIIIFLGEETMLQNIYCKQIAKVMNSSIIFEENYINIKKQVENNSPLNNVKVFVIRNNNQLADEDLFNKLKLNIAPGKLLILIFDKVDKRKCFWKTYSNITCEFEKMTDSQLSKLIQKQIGLKDDYCKMLCKLVSNDYGRLLLEMNKLEILKNIQDEDIDSIFRKALRDNLIYQECSDTSFELLDNLLIKNSKNSYNLLKELKEFDSDPFKVLGLIYSNFKSLLLLKSSRELNISPYIKKKLLSVIDNFTVNEILNILNLILEIEQGIKSGKIDTNIALEYLLAKVL